MGEPEEMDPAALLEDFNAKNEAVKQNRCPRTDGGRIPGPCNQPLNDDGSCPMEEFHARED